MSADEVLVIGAGPFGLSISAHLRAKGVGHRIVGRPMNTWRTHMPTGMKLRSEPYGSDFASPTAGYDIATYSRKHGLDYVDRVQPLSIERFLDYADWYQKQLVPDIWNVSVSEIVAVDGGFRVSFDDADPIVVRNVVSATGILPYASMPQELSGLPSNLVSHTSDHHDFEKFRGRRVAVVGGGQSALESAALLHEAGALTQIVMRRPEINWIEPNRDHVTWLGHLHRPVNKLCEGWKCAFWNCPAAFRRLPVNIRIEKARIALGPAGAWWLKDRVAGVIDVLPAHQLETAEPNGSGVKLRLQGSRSASIDVDHVVAGTGFRIDISRLHYLDALRKHIKTLNGYPHVRRNGRSTVPGLYFAGAATAVSLGPSVRFIAGTHISIRALVEALTDR